MWSVGNTLYVYSAMSGNPSHYNAIHNFNKLNEWFSLNISQQLTNGKYMYKITNGDAVLSETENTRPENFSNVKVYVSDPWHPANPGILRKLTVGGVGIDTLPPWSQSESSLQGR